MAPLIWNQLNPDFHILPSVASFKFNYKKFLTSVMICILNLYQQACFVWLLLFDWLIILAVTFFYWKRG